MHDTSARIGQLVFESYWKDQFSVVVEIGSMDTNGGLRAYKPPRAEYIGLDRQAGPGVDLVMSENVPLPDCSGDIVMATSVFEHDPIFWYTFLEMARVLRPGGFLYLNVPSNGMVHPQPFDCWRFYPDAGRALAMWARRSGIDLVLAESFVALRDRDHWNDFVAVFARRRLDGSLELPPPVSENFPSENVWVHGERQMRRPTRLTEDLRFLRLGSPPVGRAVPGP